MIFEKLGVDPLQAIALVGTVYADIGVLQHIDQEDVTAGGLDNLHQHVAEAAKLVCRARKSAFMRGVDWVVSWKGARILAGAAVAGANGPALGTTWLVPYPLRPLAAFFQL